MIKKIVQLYWYEKLHEAEEHRTFRKLYARWKKHGFMGMKFRLEKEYAVLESDFILSSLFTRRYEKLKIRTLFISIFLFSFVYIMFIKAELYESKTSLIVSDISTKTAPAGLELSLLGAGPSSQVQDSKVVQEYLLSHSVFEMLNREFSLEKHYQSDALDIFERLASSSTKEEILEFYRSRVQSYFDEASGVLHISYAHTSAQKAQEILVFLVKQIEREFNEFNRRKAKKQLDFIAVEYEKTKQQMNHSADLLQDYQNKHLLLDPNSKAASSIEILASLEASLTEKKISRSTMRSYLSKDSYELININSEIAEISKTIQKKKRLLTGDDKSRLNKVLFEFERLKMQLDFETEVYKTALIQLETTKLDVLKEAKTLSVLSPAHLADGYTYPNKPKAFVTMLILISLFYGIFTMLANIIKDHKD
jgi:capsular polysaccharide transport system permease protein